MTRWFPIAPGTILGPAPAEIAGQITATRTVPVWNETVLVAARSKTMLAIGAFPYSLELPAKVILAVTSTRNLCARVTLVSAPSAHLNVSAEVPSISTGASVNVPAHALSVAGLAAQVASGASVKPLPADTVLTALNCENAGPPRTIISVPDSEILVGAQVHSIATGASVLPPSKDLSFSGLSGSVSIVDPNFSSVSLLLHMDGSNGSTAFTDSSNNAFAVTANGNAKVSTTSAKYGTGSGLFDGNGDYLAIPAGAANFGTSNFTVEAWAYLTSNPSSPGAVVLDTIPVGGVGNRTNAMVWIITTGGKLTVFSNGSFVGTSASSIPLNQWSHIALTRSGSTWRFFIDGTLDSNSFTYSADLFTNSGALIGRVGDSASYYLNGRLDDVRITKGFARYTANFTTPIAAFPNL